jgi:regulator of sigma E protease
MILLTIITFLIILGLLVFVHELGHFVAAKKSGMEVEEFGFGFPPRMFGIKRGGTIYSINWIPLGGFVKITGEDGSDTQNPNSFAAKPAWQRFIVLIAGVSMNVVLAWLLISIGLGLGLPTVVNEDEQLPASAKIRNVSVTIIDVAEGSPASTAGFKIGDRVLKINGENIGSIDQLQETTKQQAGKPTKYTIERGDTLMEREIVPRSDPPEGQGPLGVGLSSVAFVSYPWYETVPRGFIATFNLLSLTLGAFGAIIGQWLSGQPVGEALSGPVGIAVLTRDVAALGFIYLLQFTALLSINLAVINAVPFPALDGGRVLFLFIEKLRGRKMHEKAEQIANTVGFSLLLLLMVFVTVKDINRFSDKFERLFDRVKDIL